MSCCGPIPQPFTSVRKQDSLYLRLKPLVFVLLSLTSSVSLNSGGNCYIAKSVNPFDISSTQ